MNPAHLTDPSLRPRTPDVPVPLLPMQMKLWNEVRELPRRLCAAAARVTGPLNVRLMKHTLDAAALRHESLRIRIVNDHGVPRQYAHAKHEIDLEVVDLTRISRNAVDREATSLAQALVDAPTDLSSGPLVEAKLLKLSRREHVLIVVVDHMISDDASCQILNRELWTLYAQGAQGLPCSLPELSVQFPDYAVWYAQMRSSWLKGHEAYWKTRLSSSLGIKLLPDFTGDGEPVGAVLHFPFSSELSETLRKTARGERTLLPLVVLAIYAIVASHWCNQRDLLIGFVSHGRHRHPELKTMLGFLASILYLRVEITPRDNYVDVLKKLNLEFFAATKHHDYGQLLQLLPTCTTDLLFNWLPSESAVGANLNQGGTNNMIKVQPFKVESRLPIRFRPLFYDTSSGMGMIVNYRSDLFARNTIERFVESFRFLAGELTSRPASSIASICS